MYFPDTVNESCKTEEFTDTAAGDEVAIYKTPKGAGHILTELRVPTELCAASPARSFSELVAQAVGHDLADPDFSPSFEGATSMRTR